MSKVLPGTRWWWNFCAYSTYFTPKNTKPRRIVNPRNRVINCFLLVCEAHTAIAIVKLLASSTTVLNPPSPRLSVLLPIANAWKYVCRLIVYASMIPPKNITSVTRKIHMPSVAVSFCCSSVLNCPNNAPVRCTPHSSNCQVQAPNRSPVSGPRSGLRLVVPVGRRHHPRRTLPTWNIQPQVRPVVEVVSLPRHNRCHFKIFRQRR